MYDFCPNLQQKVQKTSLSLSLRYQFKIQFTCTSTPILAKFNLQKPIFGNSIIISILFNPAIHLQLLQDPIFGTSFQFIVRLAIEFPSIFKST